MFKVALLSTLLPLAALASPQLYGPPPGPATTPATTSSAQAAVASAPADTPGQMNINVAAGGQFVFSPANITAPNGTLVTFFFPEAGLQHSVTQGIFGNPCAPMTSSSGGSQGFDSGLTMGTQFTINITDDTVPIAFFCKFPAHCGLGMVGTINAANNDTFAAYQSSAQALGGSEPTINDNGFQAGSSNAGAVALSAPTTASASPSPSSSGSSGSGSSGSNGAPGLVAATGTMFISVAAAVFVLA